jgi:uncharacterized protein DUF4388
MLRGTIEDFSLPDIFRLLSFTKKTGKLLVWRSAGDGRVFFRDGEVYFAQSSLKKEPLGQKLIRLGALTEGQLRRALDINASTGQRVGEILLDQGAITEEQLIAAVKGQIEEACFDLLRWELGEFDFESHDRFTVEIPISVSVENLIMEASRRVDELDMIRRKIPTSDVVLAVAPTPPEGAREINIAPDEWRLLVLVDGQRSVGDICEMANLDEFTGLRTMYGLLSSGLVDIISLGPEPAPSPIAHPPVATDDTPVAPPEPPPAPEVDDDGDDDDQFVVQGPDRPVEVEMEEIAEPPAPPPPTLDEGQFEVPEPSGSILGEDVEADFETSPLVPEPGRAFEPEPGETFEPEPAPAFEPEPAPAFEPEPAPAFEPEPGPAFEPDAPPVGDYSSEDDSASEDHAPVAPEWRDQLDALPSFGAPVAPEWQGETPSNGVAGDWGGDLEESGFGRSPLEDRALSGELEVPPLEEPPLPDLPSHVFEPPALPDEFPPDVAEETAEADPTPPEPGPDVSSAKPSPRVDRAAVVRELAGLFSDEEQQPRRVRASDESDEGRPEGHAKRRVEDDDQINKGLIGRFIDGVKGM